MKNTVSLLLLFFATSVFCQNNTDVALDKAKEAIKLMDKGEVDESIKMLEESQKLDPDNYIYPYEIAYAYVLKKDYGKAIKILKKVKKYKSANSQVYQMSGNCFSYLGKPEKAIKEYEEGIKRFPKVGNLHLEKGNIFLQQEKYNEAIENYENGIRADPMFASNYYRLGLLYLDSSDKLSGLIYGEIFMNIERTTARTREMSERLYNAYKNSITLGENESKIDFCEIILDAENLMGEEMKLPLCAIFGKNFILGIIDQKEVDLRTLSSMRTTFLKNYFDEDFKKYPNVLFNYQKKILEENLFDAYNHYLFQIAVKDEFNNWKEKNENEYNKFVDWYTQNDNIIQIKDNNFFIK